MACCSLAMRWGCTGYHIPVNAAAGAGAIAPFGVASIRAGLASAGRLMVRLKPSKPGRGGANVRGEICCKPGLPDDDQKRGQRKPYSVISHCVNVWFRLRISCKCVDDRRLGVLTLTLTTHFNFNERVLSGSGRLKCGGAGVFGSSVSKRAMHSACRSLSQVVFNADQDRRRNQCRLLTRSKPGTRSWSHCTHLRVEHVATFSSQRR